MELSKSLKKINFIFFLNPVPFNGQSYQKSGTIDQSLFRSRNKFRKIPLFVMYYLTKFDDASQFMTNYSNFTFPFECGKERKKFQKFEYLKNEKSFLD